MRKYIIISLIIPLIISCKRENPFANVSGYVYYYGIAIPINNVRVKVNEGIAYSDSDGSYKIPGVKKGIYTLRADKEGFDPYDVEMEFNEDLVFHNVGLVSRELTSKISGYISGDFSGDPRIGMNVIFLNPNGTKSQLRAKTDSIGFYEIKLVPAGYHSLIVEEDEVEVFREYVEVGLTDVRYDIEFSDIFEFEDARDGNKYKALHIDSLDWMIENLAFLPVVYDHEYVTPDEKRYYVYGYVGNDAEIAKLEDNYREYGALYNWKAAVNACPDGWRLPTDEEWEHLGDEVSGSWFNLQYGGYIGINGGSFEAGNHAAYWTATGCLEKSAFHMGLKDGDQVMARECKSWRHGFAVRCVR